MTGIKIEAISTDKAPKAIGPYSQGTTAGGWVFVSGQIPLDPETGNVVGTNVEEQTERVIKNLCGVLGARGLELKDVAKTTVYLKSMGEFPKFNAVYEKHFRAPFPARATVEVSRLPKDVLVEIEAIACLRK